MEIDYEKLKEIDNKYRNKEDISFQEEKDDGACLPEGWNPKKEEEN